MKRKILALGAILAVGIGSMLVASNANAQTVTCTNINNSPTQWPEAGTVRTCSGTGTPSNSGLVRGTLETIGAMDMDAAHRLRRQVITDGEVISITITDPALPGGSATVSHTAHGTQTTGADSLYTIGADLASQISALGTGFDFYANFSGDVVTIFSFTGTTSGYSMSSSGTSVTITAGTDGIGNEIATLGAQVAQNWTWFDFANAFDFEHSNPVNGGVNGPAAPPNTLDGDVYGNTYLLEDNVTHLIIGGVSGILESNTANGANQIIQHTTAHETGHRLDYLYGRKYGGTYYSSNPNFTTALSRDLEAMHLIPPCRYEGSDMTNFGGQGPGLYATSGNTQKGSLDDGGVQGLLNGVKDHTGAYICSGSEGEKAGPNGDAVSIITSASGVNYFTDTAGNILPAEHFAELVSVVLGFDDLHDNNGGDVGGRDSILYLQSWQSSQAFACTSLYVNTLVRYGREPTADELHSTYYLVPRVLTTGPDAGLHGPGWRYYHCDGTQEDDPIGWHFGG